MEVLSSYVIAGKPAADIGTDHGFVPIHLIASDKAPFVVMTDINEGPLEKAKGNLTRVGILSQYYDLRLGAGLEILNPAEVASVIIAGMGAETIIEILEEDVNKTKSYERLILHPRKRSFMLRQWLNKNGFEIVNEELVMENGKLCEIIVAEPNDNPSEIDYYLPKILFTDPLFPEFLDEYIRKVKIVIDNMTNSNETEEKIVSWKERLKEAERIKNEELRD